MIEITLPIAPLWWIAAPIMAVSAVIFIVWLERKEFKFDTSWFVLYGAVFTVVAFSASLIGVMIVTAINDTSTPELMRGAINARGVLVAQGDKLPAPYGDNATVSPVHIRDAQGRTRECYTTIWKNDNSSAKSLFTMTHRPTVSFEVLCKEGTSNDDSIHKKLLRGAYGAYGDNGENIKLVPLFPSEK